MLRDRAEQPGGLVHAFGGWLSRFFPPRSLDQYQELGYVLLAGPVLLALWLARRASFAMQDVQDLHPWLGLVLQALLKKIPLPPNVALSLSVVEVLAILYGFLWLSGRRRRAVGGFFADGLSWLAVRMVQLAAWCLDHRWYSLLLIGLLFASTGYGIWSWASDRMAEQRLEDRFGQWLRGAEELLATSALDGSRTEAARYGAVAQAWDESFSRVLSGRERRAAVCLRDLTAGVHKGYNPESSWFEHLVGRRAGLVEVYDRVADMVPDPDETRLDRLHGLVLLLLAKVHVRLSLDDCSDISMVLETNRFLQGLDEVQPALLANLRGNVYNCLFDALLREAMSPGVLGGDHGRVHAICATPGDCLDRSLDEYRKARGDRKCSFEWQRWLNNDLDVKLRLALRFDALDAVTLRAGSDRTWLASPEAFAGEIERQVAELLACNPTESVMFVTAAQAYGAAAGLRPPGSDEQARDLRAAGVFLRLAHSHRPNDLEKWNLAFFCPAVNDDGYREDFLLGLSAPSGLPRLDPDFLRHRIRTRCR